MRGTDRSEALSEGTSPDAVHRPMGALEAPARRRPRSRLVGFAAAAIVALAGLYLGRQIILEGGASVGGVPWTFIALGVLVGGLRLGSEMARRRDAWVSGALGRLALIAMVAFIVGAFGTAMLAMRASPRERSIPVASPPSAAGPFMGAPAIVSKTFDEPPFVAWHEVLADRP